MILEYDVKNNGNKFKNPLCFNFLTNSPEFTINYELSNIIEGNFPHVGITARQGLTILYKKGDNWLNVNTYARDFNKTIDMRPMIDNSEEYEVLVYGPILSKIEKFSISVPEENTIRKIERNYENKLLVIGGMHSFGIGCTTTGVMFSNILSRKLDLEVNQITFNNRNYIKDIYYFLNNNEISNYEYIIFELDYLNQDDELVNEYLVKTIDLLKNHCKKIIGWIVIPPKNTYKKNNLEKLIHQNKLDKKVLIYDFSDIYDDALVDMCTSSDYFINDTGNIIIFKKLINILRSLEKWNI